MIVAGCDYDVFVYFFLCANGMTGENENGVIGREFFVVDAMCIINYMYS